MPHDKLVTVSALAQMLAREEPDAGWTRPLVWYWLHRTRIEVQRLPNGFGVIPEARAGEVLFKLRAARAGRRHDGQGGGEARARRIHQGGVY